MFLDETILSYQCVSSQGKCSKYCKEYFFPTPQLEKETLKSYKASCCNGFTPVPVKIMLDIDQFQETLSYLKCTKIKTDSP